MGMPSATRVGEWSETFEQGVNRHPHLMCILYVLSVILYSSFGEMIKILLLSEKWPLKKYVLSGVVSELRISGKTWIYSIINVFKRYEKGERSNICNAEILSSCQGSYHNMSNRCGAQVSVSDENWRIQLRFFWSNNQNASTFRITRLQVGNRDKYELPV